MSEKLPDGWKKVKLGEAPIIIIDGDRGKNYPKKDDLLSSGYCLFLNTKNVTKSGFDFSECSFITKEKDLSLKSGKLKRNDIVLTTRGTVGNVAFYNNKIEFENIRINSGMVILRPINPHIEPLFVYYLIKYSSPFLLEFISGSAQPQLPIRDLKNLEVLLPPLHEQKAIAGILSSLDDKIDLLHRQNKTLEKMAQTLFRKWFIEDAQEDWEEVRLGDIVEIKIGRTPPRKEFQWFSKIESEENIKWVSVKDLGENGVFILKTDEFLTKEAVKKFKIPVIPPNTVLLSFKMTVGRVGITTEEMVSNEAIAHFKFNQKTPITTEYLYLFLKSFKFQELGSTSTIVTSINSAIIKDIKILIPGKNTMLKFHNHVLKLFEKIKNNQFQIRTLEQLRDTLLPKLISGEVRVRK
jgi:type I restriction enzyme S subunit